MEKPEKEFIVVQDGIVKSIIADTYMFLSIVCILAVNHYLLNDSTFGSWLFSIIFIFSIISKASAKTKRLKGKQALISYLQELQNDK